jgi:drug/metabolite transporter (DMT)-like permease
MSANIATEPSRETLRSSGAQLQSFLVFGAACAAIILFALVPATTRIAAAQLSGLSIGLIRTVGAGLFSLPLLLVLRSPLPQTLKEWGLLLLYAFGNFAGFPMLFGIGVQHTSCSHAALIMAVMPLFIGLIGMVLERRLPRGIWFVGVAIAVSGETALVGMGNTSSSAVASFGGDAIVFAACTLSAVGIVAGARLGSRIGPFAATLWGITIASASLAPWAATRLLTSRYGYADLSATTWTAVLQITLGAAVIANMSWLWAVSRGGLVRIAPIQFAQPVCALFFATTLLNERLSTSLLLVAVSIVLGTVTACRGARPNPARQASNVASLQSGLKNAPALVPEPGHIEALLKLVDEPEDEPVATRPTTPASSVREFALS